MQPSSFSALLLAALVVGACASTAEPPPAHDVTQITDVSPPGGSAGVSVGATMSISFSGPVPSRIGDYVALHLGPITGPTVAGTVSWSPDGMRMTFVPDMPLAAHTGYTLHVGGGMMDDVDRPVDYSRCPQFGGQTVTGGMMGNGMGSMMGTGWQGATGGYGMMFAFTTS